jgi:hypothetical protein
MIRARRLVPYNSMFALSLFAVFTALGVFVANVVLSGYGMAGPGVAQILYAPVPWWILAAMAGGSVLGVISLFGHRSPARLVAVAAEILVAGFLSFLLVAFTNLPSHELSVSVGDVFPSYSLHDQDGVLRHGGAGATRKRALYIFYRGDW